MAKQEKSAAELYREERKARLAKAAKKNSKKSLGASVSTKTVKAITAVIALVVVAAIAFSVVSATGVLERRKVALKVGENDVTMAEYSYYYNAAYSNLLEEVNYIEQQMPGYGAQFYGYDMYTMPDEQAYTAGEIEGVENPTWADYFADTAKTQIKYKQAAIDYAKENKIALDDEDYADIDKIIENWSTQAAQSNYSLTAFLQANYGKCMSTDIFRGILEDQTLVQKVQDTKNEEIKATFSDKEVDKAFNNDLASYGAVSYRSYSVNADKVASKDEEGNDTSAVTEKTMAAAKAEAEAFAAGIADEESFKKAASKAEEANKNEKADEYLTDDSLTLYEDAVSADVATTDEKASEWLFSKDTKKGDVFVAEEEGTGYTVLYMVDPVHKAPDTVVTYDVRHILVKFPTEEKTETDAEEKPEIKTIDTKAYKDVVIDIDVDAEKVEEIESYNKAIDILTEYLNGDKTEDSFGKLAKKYTEDTNGEQGGLYEDVTQGYMLAEFEDWSSDLSRKAGDVGMVETTYGYHVMYFVDAETTSMEDTIRNDLAAEDLQKFLETFQNAEIEVTVADEKVVADVHKNMMKLAKQNIQNMNSYGAGY